jgi:hypothetical protein
MIAKLFLAYTTKYLRHKKSFRDHAPDIAAVLRKRDWRV